MILLVAVALAADTAETGDTAPPAPPVRLAFPASQADYLEFKPTSYRDHGADGAPLDWHCGAKTYERHLGTDFAGGGFAGMDEGRDITASADGTVLATNDGEFDRCTTMDCEGGGGLGNFVKIQHPDGHLTIYAHLKQWSVAVAVGDAVRCGQIIGQMGSSGYSTGPHVHLQLDQNGLDPFAGDCTDSPGFWVEQGEYLGLPGVVCEHPDPCVPVGALACGDRVAIRNDGAGSTTHGWRYGDGAPAEPGAETAWTLALPETATVALQLTGATADLDLFVLPSAACDGSGVLASSATPGPGDEELVLRGAAGATWTVVVDSADGAASDAVLSVACFSADAPGVAVGFPGSPPRATPDLPAPGPASGCTMTPGAPAAAAVLAALLLRRRR